MNITVAKTAGFCFGVDRAVQIVDGLLDRQQRVCTLGPIIHNPQTLSRLAQRGVRVVETPQEVSAGEMLVIRSHGVAQAVFDEMESRAVQYVDQPARLLPKFIALWPRQVKKGKLFSLPEIQATRKYRESSATAKANIMFLKIIRNYMIY